MSPRYSFSSLVNQERFSLSEKATGIKPLLPVSFLIEGDLQPKRLITALHKLVSCREMLRARLSLDSNGHCIVHVCPPQDTVTMIDISELSSKQQAQALQRLVSTQLKEHDGIFRAVLIKIGSGRFSLTIIPHHGVVDGVSIGVILSELSTLYNNPDSDLSADDGQFQRACKHTEAIEKNRQRTDTNYWTRQLAELPAQQPLPAAHQFSDPDSRETGYIEDLVPQDLHARARSLAHRIGVRTFSLYLGLGQIALQRLSGEPDIAVSIQSAGRRGLDLSEQLIGMFSRALIIRTPEDARMLVSERLRAVDEHVTGALQHETLSYQNIIECAGSVPRYAFNWYPIYDGLMLKDCLCHETVIVPWPTTFDLNFHFQKCPDGLKMRVFFDKTKCTEQIALTAVTHVRQFLESILENVDTIVAHLPTASAPSNDLPELAQRADLGRIEVQFRQQAKRTPDRIAISHSSGDLKYKDVLSQTETLANLITQHAPPAPRVAIIGSRSPSLAIAALASLEAGGSFLLIDPCYPESRIQSMIAHIDANCVILCDGLANNDFYINLLNTENMAAVTTNVFGINHLYLRHSSRIRDETKQVAYWLFTSGSTGQPKCISTDHAPLLMALKWQMQAFSLKQDTRVSFLSGISHDPALRDMFLPLLWGGTLCIPDSTRFFEPLYLRDWINKQRISTVHLTPSLLNLILTGITSDDRMISLGHVFLGGEKADKRLVETLRKVAPDAHLINVYGASETPQIVLYRKQKGIREPYHAEAIGWPRPDVTVRIQDRDGRICGRFEPGEITIGTPYLSNGYLGGDQDALSPFHFTEGGSGSGYYRTGDRGYFSETGETFLIGRIDNQIKIRGYRVEPDEVASCLKKVAGTSQAAVVARPDGSGSFHLIAFVAHLDEVPNEKELIACVSKRLPSYMVPKRIIFVDQLPLLPNGKIDLQTLLTQPLPEQSEREGYTLAQTPQEERLVKLWEDVLGTSPISVTDSFLDLGGDSLTAVRLMLELERSGLSEATARAILQGATIRELAEAQQKNQDPVKETGPIPAGPLLSRTAIHGMRGFLVCLLVAGHWFPGFAARVPFLKGLGEILTPLFNLSTPGFAMIFGASLGYFNYDIYKRQRRLFQRQIRLGLLVLSAAMILISAVTLLTNLLRGTPLSSHLFFMSFYNVLGFYLLAVASTPVWFHIINRVKMEWVALLALLALYISLDLGMRWAFLGYEPLGLIQLFRLYATAKFSYFNMAVGALLGLIVGIAIRRHPELPFHPLFIITGPSLVMAGLVWGYFLGEVATLAATSPRIVYWKWCFYLGVILCLAAIFWPVMAKYGQRHGSIPSLLKLLVAIGVLALPFFIFHGLILSIKSLLDAIGLPDLVGILMVLSLFFGISGFAVQRVWRLYFN